MRQQFIEWEPTTDVTKGLLAHAISVSEEYSAQGYQLTLRQLYYQLVARDIIPNSQRWYKRLGEVVNKGRLAGHIDWNMIVDRGRISGMPAHWDSPSDILMSAAASYRTNRWAGQNNYVEVWVEKDALMGVLEPVCNREHVRSMACRGYTSVTSIYDASKRILDAWDDLKRPYILYLGDHDPSGLDMSRDIFDRLAIMLPGVEFEVERLALNMDQVITYSPPPNPTKLTDSRAGGYIKEFGNDSWELDALDPATLTAIVEEAIYDLRDESEWAECLDTELADKELISAAAEAMQKGL